MPSCFIDARSNNQFLSIGPPATTILRPLRSASVRIEDEPDTITAPSALEYGQNVNLAPSPRSRDTHNQSETMTSAPPPRNAILPASGLASSLTSIARFAFLSC